MSFGPGWADHIECQNSLHPKGFRRHVVRRLLSYLYKNRIDYTGAHFPSLFFMPLNNFLADLLTFFAVFFAFFSTASATF